MIYKSILIISDTHIPYESKYLFPFLKYLKSKYKKFDRVIHLGDEVDNAGMSFHDKDSEMPSAGDELKLALPKISSTFSLSILFNFNLLSCFIRI